MKWPRLTLRKRENSLFPFPHNSLSNDFTFWWSAFVRLIYCLTRLQGMVGFLGLVEGGEGGVGGRRGGRSGGRGGERGEKVAAG